MCWNLAICECSGHVSVLFLYLVGLDFDVWMQFSVVCVVLLWDGVKPEGLFGMGSSGLDPCGLLGGGVFLYTHGLVLLFDNIVSGARSEQ